MTSTRPDTPAATVEHFSELLGAGALEELLELYEDDAAFVPEPGRTVNGIDSIRAELEPLAALTPRMSGRVEQVVVAGDTATRAAVGAATPPTSFAAARTARGA